MGGVKRWMMEQEALEPMYEWIEENYGDDAGEEGSEEWEEAVQAYEDLCGKLRRQEEEWYQKEEEEELKWYIYTQSQVGKFDTQIQSVLELLEVRASNEAKFSLLVMLHGHIVAAIESYLASSFIHKVTNSEELIRRLVETDPILSEKKFTLKEIHEKHENLKLTVASHLKNLIFHNIAKVKPMFKEVLGCEFGDITWLFKAVDIRHHCVHRAGIDKDGNRVNLTKLSIQTLASKSSEFIHFVENGITKVTDTSCQL